MHSPLLLTCTIKSAKATSTLSPIGVQGLPKLLEEVSQSLRADVLSPGRLPGRLILLQLPIQQRPSPHLPQ